MAARPAGATGRDQRQSPQTRTGRDRRCHRRCRGKMPQRGADRTQRCTTRGRSARDRPQRHARRVAWCTAAATESRDPQRRTQRDPAPAARRDIAGDWHHGTCQWRTAALGSAGPRRHRQDGACDRRGQRRRDPARLQRRHLLGHAGSDAGHRGAAGRPVACHHGATTVDRQSRRRPCTVARRACTARCDDRARRRLASHRCRTLRRRRPHGAAADHDARQRRRHGARRCRVATRRVAIGSRRAPARLLGGCRAARPAR